MSKKKYVIESGKKLSESSIWKLQSQYFKNQGISAWSEDIVPEYITSNIFIADKYVNIILAYLKDIDHNNEKIYLLDLGAGSGKFTFYFLNKLSEKLSSNIKLLDKVCYVMVDYSQKNIEFWKTQVQLKKYLEKGNLDFALFDANSSTEIKLLKEKKVISINEKVSNLIIIANYFFDSIHQDAFLFKNNEIFEAKIDLISEKKEININDLDLIWNYEKTKTDYYSENKYNELLDYYKKVIKNSSILFPIGALKIIDLLESFTKNNFLLLTGDKGIIDLEYLENMVGIEFIKHGSFSFYVNFHSIIHLARMNGFQSFYHPTNEEINIVSITNSKKELGNVSKVYFDTNMSFNVEDYYFLLKKLVFNKNDLDIRESIAITKLSMYDPEVFYNISLIFLEGNQKDLFFYKEKIIKIISEISENYYIYNKVDLYFIFGCLMLKLGKYNESLDYINLSIEVFGANFNSFYNKGISFYFLNKMNQALSEINLALKISPNHKNALFFKDKIISVIKENN